MERTFVASIRNHREVQPELDPLGFAANKLWNVGRWTIDCVWDETGFISEEGDLKSYLRNHERYADLHSQVQPSVYLFDSESVVSHRENRPHRKPEYPNRGRDSHVFRRGRCQLTNGSTGLRDGCAFHQGG